MSEHIVVGGGCFWCIEAAFKEVDGVIDVVSGYAGGHSEDPSYREVCSGKTGHAEVVKLEYDQDEIELGKILEIFFRIHDPTTKDRQGPDVGSQYRSIILFEEEKQEDQIKEFIESQKSNYSDEIVTEVAELEKFYRAEEKHQDYFEKNPDDAYCTIHAQPKVDKVREDF